MAGLRWNLGLGGVGASGDAGEKAVRSSQKSEILKFRGIK